ncbi:hypothetical protein [Bacillus sp. REN10]|uniref:hypothetical protein n=1 Tax=Bacillus sp. REN10 TaxID=2782541 RepID=UPI00193BBC1F|nr:hypothetical protein [Bacillus sp. REN10]
MLRLKWGGLALFISALLVGCGAEEAKQEKKEEPKQAEETNETPSQTVKQPIEEAKNLPPEVKEEIMAVFEQHISTFNAKDLDGYIDTLSETSRDLEEERQYVKKYFDAFDIHMEPQHTKIIQYDEKKQEAHMFIVMKSVTKDLETGKEVEDEIRQVMTFKKEKEGWKQAALSAMQ